MAEMRCDNKLHGLLDGNTIEIKCDSRFCGARPGLTILHRFSVSTGELVETNVFSNPPRPRKEVNKP